MYRFNYMGMSIEKNLRRVQLIFSFGKIDFSTQKLFI